MSWRDFPLRLFFGGLTIFGAILNWWGRIVDLLNFSDDMESLIAYVPRFEADWGLYIILGLVGLTSTFFIPVWKSRSQKDNRQPINQAYEVSRMVCRVVQEDGQEDGNEHHANCWPPETGCALMER